MKHDVIVPSAGESIREVTVGNWKFKNGDQVKKDDVLVDLESQKATFEIQAEFSGTLEILKSETQTVAIGDVIAKIDDSTTGAEPTIKKQETPPPPAPISTTLTASSTINDPETPMSPAVRKIVSEKNMNPQSVSGTGKNGRLLKEDVVFGSVSHTKPVTTSTDAKQSVLPSYPIDSERGETAKPSTTIRKQIAINLVKAQHEAAILSTFNEVDMTEIMAFRKKNKVAFQKKHGVSLGMTGFFALACSKALQEFPLVNSTFTGDEIISRTFVDISIAVSTDRGLVVPVIRDVNKMKLSDFEKKLSELSEKAKNKKLSIPEMTGGTFTISNGGVFGSLLSTPILNRPQSAILGLHKIQDRPVAIKNKVAIRPMMYVALSYDHRIIDGKDAVSFLVKVKEYIENLDLILSKKDI